MLINLRITLWLCYWYLKREFIWSISAWEMGRLFIYQMVVLTGIVLQWHHRMEWGYVWFSSPMNTQIQHCWAPYILLCSRIQQSIYFHFTVWLICFCTMWLAINESAQIIYSYTNRCSLGRAASTDYWRCISLILVVPSLKGEDKSKLKPKDYKSNPYLSILSNKQVVVWIQIWPLFWAISVPSGDSVPFFWFEIMTNFWIKSQDLWSI